MPMTSLQTFLPGRRGHRIRLIISYPRGGKGHGEEPAALMQFVRPYDGMERFRSFMARQRPETITTWGLPRSALRTSSCDQLNVSAKETVSEKDGLFRGPLRSH